MHRVGERRERTHVREATQWLADLPPTCAACTDASCFIRIGREALRGLLLRRGITSQRTKT